MKELEVEVGKKDCGHQDINFTSSKYLVSVSARFFYLSVVH